MPKSVRRAMPVLEAPDGDAARALWVDLLGFEVAMDEDGLLMLRSPTTPTTQVIVCWPSPTAMDPMVRTVDVSVEVGDVDLAYAQARERGLEIVYELTDEPWGVRRFFVRDPAGHTVNVASHR